jgi:hypothetical protein
VPVVPPFLCGFIARIVLVRKAFEVCKVRKALELRKSLSWVDAEAGHRRARKRSDLHRRTLVLDLVLELLLAPILIPRRRRPQYRVAPCSPCRHVQRRPSPTRSVICRAVLAAFLNLPSQYLYVCHSV